MSVSAYFQPIPDERLYEFFAEFGATRESVKTDLETLKEWMRKTPYLPVVEDDEWLRNFLLRSKNSLERAKRKLETHFISRALTPEIFENRDPREAGIKWIFQNSPYLPCRKLTPEGYRIVIACKFSSTDNYIPTTENVLKSTQLVIDILCKIDIVRGYIIINNLKNMTPAFITMMMPITGKFISLLTTTTPHRLRKYYLVNTAPYMDVAIKLMKSFASKKLNKRIEVWHDDISKFVDIYPKEVLPSDLGGDEKSLIELRDLWYEEVIKHREWSEFFEKYKGDLDKLPKDYSDGNVQPDMNGSFHDVWLLNFLLRSKNSLEKTKQNLERHLISKAQQPEIFQNRDLRETDLKRIYLNTVFVPCPKLTADGNRIMIFKAFDKTENFIPTGENLLKSTQAGLDVLSVEDTCLGYIMICNLENLTPAFLAVLIPITDKFAALFTKITPIRIRKIYIVNAAPYMEVAIKLMKSFLSKKLNERVEVWHDDVSKFADILPKEVLPSDLGGDEKSLVELRDLWYEEVVKHREWLKFFEKYKADLNKIPNGHSNRNIQHDMSGSFRKLRID